MDDILASLNDLSCDELRSELTNLGETVGPIPENAKSIFRKKIAKLIYKKRYGVHYEAGTDTPQNTVVKQDENHVDNHVEDNKKGDAKSQPSIFYGVCLPAADKKNNESVILTEKTEALALLKKFKGSRFKTFKSYDEARTFSQMSEDDICPSPQRPNQPNKEGTPGKEIANIDAEKSAYKAPKVPELMAFRKTIEKGDIADVSRLVWENPRYLISSCDTPVILQEGFRYNALHVAAKSNRPKICELIIHTIENPLFIEKLYCNSKETEATRTKRINFLVDLYINMPDKGFFESPLHFACKFGFADVVEVLVMHPLINFSLSNRYGQTPKDVVCTRSKIKSDENKKRIEELLEGQCFVPLMRYEDNSVAPQIGDPLSPEKLYNSSAEFPLNSSNNRDPRFAVRALAGPMSPSKAQLFHKKWTTPPAGNNDQKRQFCSIKRGDCDKGLERIGRNVAQDLKVPWKEYWDFMNCFADLTHLEGLVKLETYLQLQYVKQVVSAERKMDNDVENCGNVSVDSIHIGNSLLDSVQRRIKPGLESGTPIYSLMKNIRQEDNNGHASLESSKNNRSLDSSCDILKKVDLNITDPDVVKSRETSTDSLKHRLDFDVSISDSFCLENDTSFNFRTPFVLKDSLSIDSDSDLSNLSQDSHNGLSSSKATSKQMNRYLTSSPVLTDKIHLETDYEDILSEAMFKQLKLSDSSITSPVHLAKNDAIASSHNDDEDADSCYSDDNLDYLSAASSLDSDEYSDAIEDDPTPNLILSLSCEDDFKLCSCDELVLIERSTQNDDSENPLVFSADVISVSGETFSRPVKLKDVVVKFKSKSDIAKLTHVNQTETVSVDVILKKDVNQNESTNILKTALFINSSLPGVSSLFIRGYQPTKSDVDVYRAVEKTHITREDYPFIYYWKDTVLSFSEPDRKGWPSPANVQRKRKVTRLQNLPE